MMNVFVLCTGRCGSTTFAKAASHASNATSGHETHASKIGAARLAYPPAHIEADNRLSWMLGRLEARWGDQARYVHLIRDPEATARSFTQRISTGIISAYRRDIIMGSERRKTGISDFDFAMDYVETVNANIEQFLRYRRHRMTVRLETAKPDFAEFWYWAGLSGDLDAGLAEWDILHNAGRAHLNAAPPLPA